MVFLIFVIYNFNYFKDNNKNIFVKLIILKFLLKCLNYNLKDIIWVFYKKRVNFFLILKFKWFLYISIWSFNYKLNINSVKYIYL